MTFLLGELFCGPGGLAYGAALAGHRPIINSAGEAFSIVHLWGVDKDQDAIETYNRNIAEPFGGEGIAADALCFAKKLSPAHARINALAFGFPCNDFSMVGEQKGIHGEFGELYRTGIEVISQTDPLWFVAENVSGINSANQGAVLKKILGEMASAGRGYTLTANLYKFEEYGVPQYRHRFIIVGIRRDLGLKFRVPKPQLTEENFVSVGKALEGLTPTAANMTFQRVSPTVVKRLKLTPPWHNAWYLDNLQAMSPCERRKILSKAEWYERDLAMLSDEEIAAMLNEAQLHCTAARMSHIYKRLQKDRPSYTITGSGGGGTHGYHWAEHRPLTNRERARIQTFPDDFVFEGTSEKVRKQIGMAVPPLGAKIIFDAILRTFAKMPYDSTEEEYDIEDIDSLNAANSVSARMSFLQLKDMILKRIKPGQKFQYSENENLYIRRLEGGAVVYTCNRKAYRLKINDIERACTAFYKMGKLSITLLQERDPLVFAPSKLDKNYNAFLAIAVLAKFKIGVLHQPNGRICKSILEPLEEE